MKKVSKFYKCLNYILAVALFTAAMLSTAASQTAPSASSKTQLMFVQSAEDLKVDAAKNTFRLVKVNQQTLYFSDRPERIAGHMKMDQYLAEWAKAEGPDNFSSRPAKRHSVGVRAGEGQITPSSWSRSVIRSSTATTFFTATRSSTAQCPALVAQPRCLSTRSVSAVESVPGFTVWVSVVAGPAQGNRSSTSTKHRLVRHS